MTAAETSGSGSRSKKARLRRGLKRAEAEQACRNHAEALRLYSALIDEFPETPEIYWDRGLLLDRMRRYDEAIADLTRVLDFWPGHIGTYFWRGALWVHVDKPDEAVEDLSRVIESGWHYTLSAAHFCRAAARLRQQRFEDALADIRHAPDDSILGYIFRYEWKTAADIVEAAEAGLRRRSSPTGSKASRWKRMD